MSISAKDVMALRQKTGAGMMDCKKALTETNGDFDAAEKWLREKGISSAAKRSGREASEGRIGLVVKDDNSAGAIVEINSETDFVARNEEFIALVDKYAENALANAEKADGDGLLPEGTLDTTAVTELAGKIGENLGLARAGALVGGYVAKYAHSGDLTGTTVPLGVLVQLEGADAASDAGKELAHDLAMQIAATNPQFLRREQVPAEVIEKEKEIYKSQMRNEGKPEDMLEKIAAGKINKFFQDICLLEQEYVKEAKTKVSDRIKNAGGDIQVKAFLRFKVGEGAESGE